MVLFPFIVGIGLAYVWNLLLKPIEKHFLPKSKNKIINRIRRPASIFISFIIILAIVTLTLYLIIPQILESIRVIAEGIPILAENLRNWFLRVTEGINWAEEYRKAVEQLDINWADLASKGAEFLHSSLGGILGSTFNIISGLVGLLITGITALIFNFYALSEKDKLSNQIDKLGRAYLKDSTYEKTKYVLKVADESYSSYFKGQLLDAFIIGFILFVVLLIFRMPYALTIGVVVMVTSLIPLIGAFLGGLIGFLMIAAVNLNQALIFIILLIISQQLEGDFIYPKIVGDSIGLPGMWVFVAVVLGGALAGPIGMILFVPLAATLYKLLRNAVNKRLENKENKVKVNEL